MAELAPVDLPATARARFADDAAAQTAIDAALAAARRYCGWVVSPVQEGVPLTLDGPGGHVLSLPTLNLLDVISVFDDGIEVPTQNLRWSQQRGVISKKFGCRWSAHFGAIRVVVTHGYDEAEAADFRTAIIGMVATSAQTLKDTADMKRKKVDDVEYEWYDSLITSDQQLAARFSAFRILPSP